MAESTTAAGVRGIEVVAGFESTYLPLYDIDCTETTSHAERWREDLDGLLGDGVRTLRYPVRWHRIEAEQGSFDWAETDRVLGHLHDRGARPIIDLVHHTSYPSWLRGGFGDPAFGPAFVRFAEAVARRYPWLPAYTLFNEPFATLFLAGHEALWPPYDRGMPGFARLLLNVLPAVLEAGECYRSILPHAENVWVDTCERHSGSGAANEAYAALANDRRFLVLDLVHGRDISPERPAVAALTAGEGAGLLELDRRGFAIDVLGLDYYPHSEWYYDEQGSRAPSPYPAGFATIAAEYAARYDVPLMLSETDIRGLPSDQATWLRYVVDQYERAQAAGLPLRGLCWFPQVDSCDWDSLLVRPAGRRDPVGVLRLEADGSRSETTLTRSWRAVVHGARAADLPAYRLQSPADSQLAGYAAAMSDWPWQDPPAVDVIAANELRMEP